MDPENGRLPPQVSVLMTAFNRQQFIAEAIESVLTSSYNNFELIIVDDGSKDNTVAIAKQFADKDARINIYINEKNLGDYPNRNKAVSLAKGKYIMFCDSDDCFYPDTIEYCVNAMKQFPTVGIGFYYANDNGSPFLMNRSEAILKHFFSKPILTIGPGGTISDREFLIAIGGYPERYGPANDMYFNLKATSKTDILLLPKLFLNYRIHENQEQKNIYSYIYNNYRYLDDALKDLDLGLTGKQLNYLQKKNKRRFSVNLVRYLARTKDFPATRKLWQKAHFNFSNFITGIFQI